MKKLLIVYDGAIPKEVFEEKNKHLFDVAKNNNIEVTFKSNIELHTFLSNNIAKCFGGYSSYDYAFFFNKDVYLAKNLELLDVKVVNNSQALLMCENKANMYQEMIANKISIPKTFILPIISEYDIEKLKPFIEDAINELTLPLVIKEWYGESGNGVYLVKSKQDVYAVVEHFKGQGLLLQEFIAESAGTDIRVYVIKGKVVSALRRQAASGNFRSNVTLGGKLTPYIPTIIETKLAIDAAKAMKCDFAVVDILKSVTGSLVCEVNSTANINNFYECTKVDIAEAMIKSCLK